ncbi:LysR family transcriptional regulator [Leisingera methylohalidivorans]|uniref:LysR family transcriptional regulator n=1 Tax=Leisingera methylohalidivorans DSM 14336 TaxID=999552 RepID=V9VTS4_9RHOB|nr:LysR family transcriptional regulator [Leisingera methylohalidivorans]AHD02151.1 LysR family transcriptional regulator [Leisingera methylohalidivorans DSM 14336]
MNLSDLTLIQDIARHGSFAAVARRREVDPSSIGRLVAAVEAELGFRLFARTTRRMELTEAGGLYLARIAPLTEELDRAAEESRAMQSEPRGTLRLSASATFGQKFIVPRLASFRRTYPEVAIEGLFTDSNVDLVADRIDLAIRLAPAIQGDCIAAKLMDTHYRVVAAPDYLREAPPLARPEDIAHHRAILFPYRDYRSRWIFRDANGTVTEQQVCGNLVLSPAGAIRDAVLAGLGPALLPEWLIEDDLANSALCSCIEGWDVTATSSGTAAWLIYPNRSYLPAKVRAMIGFLRGSIHKEA